jgi:hypothetical protein
MSNLVKISGIIRLDLVSGVLRRLRTYWMGDSTF